MKGIILITCLALSSVCFSQTVRLSQLRDSALSHYIDLRNALNNNASRSEIAALSDKYKACRTRCLNQLKTKAAKDRFLSWIVSEYKKGHTAA